ncbi:MAG: hypothetical protein ABI434_00825 [Burkholderiaceae bacterium]
MSAKNLSTITNDLITSYGKTARNMIHVYRMGNQRFAHYIDRQWEKALAQSASELRSEVRKNALSAQKTANDLYVRSITVSSNGADGLIGKVVELAGKGVQQVAANASRFEERTGLKALDNLANAAKPAVNVVSVLAEKLEARSSQLASKVAGHPAGVKLAAVKRVTPRRKATPGVHKAATARRASRKAVTAA